MDYQLQREADVLWAGFRAGYFETSDIERWADGWIETIEQPSDGLLELSILKRTHPINVLNLLRSIGSQDRQAMVGHRLGFLGLLHESSRISLESTVRTLYQLVLEADVKIDSEIEGKVYWLDDSYDLAVQGSYGSLELVESDTREFLAPYAAKLKEDQVRLFDMRGSEP